MIERYMYKSDANIEEIYSLRCQAGSSIAKRVYKPLQRLQQVARGAIGSSFTLIVSSFGTLI